jgi:hypothetical protein
MKISELKKLILEEITQLLEYEIYVDDQGYAHDDEGNSWHIGRQYSGGTYGLRELPRGGRPGASRSRRSTMAYPHGTSNELINVIGRAIEEVPSTKAKEFLSSVLSQYRRKGSLSEKQKAVVEKIFVRLDLAHHVRLIDTLA